MKSRQASTLFLGALFLVFGTLAITRPTEAQGLKVNGAALKGSIPTESASGVARIAGEVSHFVVDENYAWATVGTTVYRIDRNTMSLSAIPLRVVPPPPVTTPSGLVEAPKSGIRGLLKPPGERD